MNSVQKSPFVVRFSNEVQLATNTKFPYRWNLIESQYTPRQAVHVLGSVGRGYGDDVVDELKSRINQDGGVYVRNPLEWLSYQQVERFSFPCTL